MTTTEVNTSSPSDVRKDLKKVKRFQKKSRSMPGQKDNDHEFDKRIINIRRVTRVYKGGKRMRLSVFLAVGDKKGKVGLGIGKGADVKAAEEKAYSNAVKNMVMVNIKGVTIPHEIKSKYKAAKVFMKPAAPGTGIIAGAPVRAVVELAGVKDILTKRIGSTNSVTVAYATITALKSLKSSRL